MPTNPSRDSLRCWRDREVRVLWSGMGGLRVTLALVAGALFAAASPACASGETVQASEAEIGGEPARVPDPPPRYTRVDLDSGITVPDDDSEPTLQIRCGGQKPYVCPLDDGTFRCSEYPCVPACDRVGCLGGEVCLPCDGGFRCVARGGNC